MSLIRDITNSSFKDVLHITDQLVVSGTSTFNTIETENITVSAVTELADLVVRNITVTGTTSGTDGQVFAGARGEPGEKGEKGDTVVNEVDMNSPLFTGIVTTGNVLQLGENGNDSVSKTLKFGGVYNDNTYEHAVIENRMYAIGTENSELLLFKGNDTATESGPDRIRIKAGEIRFDLLESADNNRTSENTKFMLTSDGSMKHTACNNSYTEYGPNTDNGKLTVGACPNTTGGNNGLNAQVICTNGSLHLDGGKAKGVYLNHHSPQSYVRIKGTVTMENSCSVSGTLSCIDCNSSGQVSCQNLIIGTRSLRNYILDLVPPPITFQPYMSLTPSDGFYSLSINPSMYRRTSEFEVVFTGEVVRDDNTKTFIFTLPLSHCPKYFCKFLVPTRSINFAGDVMYGTAHITISRDGDLILNRTDDIIISLEGIRFISENRQP